MPSAATAWANVLLVSHTNQPEFTQATRSLTAALEKSGRFRVSVVSVTANGVPALANLSPSEFAAVVLLAGTGQPLPHKQVAGLERFVKAGGGVVVCHTAVLGLRDSETFGELLGAKLVNQSPDPFYYKVAFQAEARDGGHPLAVRNEDFAVYDTFVHVEAPAQAQVFAVSHMDQRPVPAGFTRTSDKARLVYLANGGTAEAVGNRYFQRLVERALRFTGGETFEGTIRAGIIGYGGAFNMGLQHANAINAQFGMQTAAVCDLDERRVAQAREELGEHIATYRKADELLADADINLVVVILPHNLHAETCVAAAKAGKHVVTEKPFSITINEADRMIAAAGEAGTLVSCFHNRRWDGDFLRILETVRNDTIGPVFHIDAATAGWSMPRPWWRASKTISGGALYDWGAHYMDWILNLMPKRIESVSGIVHKRFWHNTTNEDFVRATIRFEDGTTATLEQGSLAAIRRQGWRILGARGGMSNAGPGAEITLVQRGVDGEQSGILTPFESNWVGYYKNIGNHLLMGEPLVVTAEQARRAIGVIELAGKSSAQGGKPLALPGEDSFEANYIVPW